MFSTCPFTRPSVRPSVLSFVCYRTCKHDILKTNKPILTPTDKWSTGHRHETFNFGDQDIEGQGYTRPKIDIKVF